MTRQTTALRPPKLDLDLTNFPTVALTEDGVVFRAHNAQYTNPWYFSNDGQGRFDLTGNRGTCYAADDTETAARERLGSIIVESQAVERDLAEKMAVTGISIWKHTELASITDARAVHYGLTREACTTPDYLLTQPWAELFASKDLDGIHYSSRFTTEAEANSFALFGPAGPAPDRTFFAETRIEGVEACRRARIRILPSTLDDETAEVVPPPTSSPHPASRPSHK